MAIKLEEIRSRNEELNRVQSNVAKALLEVPAASTDSQGIVNVNSSPGTKVYAVTETDRHIVTHTNLGQVTVSLPSPASKRVVGVLAADGTYPTVVKRGDGQAAGFGATKDMGQGEAAAFLADGKQWHEL